MTLTLNLKPEVEAGLMAHALAAGLSLQDYATQVLEDLGGEGAVLQRSAGERLRAFEEFVEEFQSAPVLTEEAFHRENWYSDR